MNEGRPLEKETPVSRYGWVGSSSATTSVAKDGKFFRTSKMPMSFTEHQDAFV